MDLASMFDAAALLLGIGAFGGLWMAVMRFMSQRNPPAWLAMVHGFLAAAGLTLMIYAWTTGGAPRCMVKAEAARTIRTRTMDRSVMSGSLAHGCHDETDGTDISGGVSSVAPHTPTCLPSRWRSPPA